MNDPIPVSPVASGSDLEQQVAALQRQMFLLLVALNVIAATIVFYFYYESHIANVDYDEGRPRAVQIIEEYRKNALSIQKFDQELAGFGTKNPGFQPVLKKYGWTPTSSSTPSVPTP